MSHPKSLLRLPWHQLPCDIQWTGPERLVVELAKFIGSLDRPKRLGEIIASDAEGKWILPIFNRDWVDGRGGWVHTADDGYATIASLPSKANGHFYMQTYMWDDEKNTWLYDVNADKGVRHLVAQINAGDMDFTLDPDGNLHYAQGFDLFDRYVVYRMQNGQWVQLANDERSERIEPLLFSQDKQHLYALASVKGGPLSLVRTNADGTQSQLLTKDDFGNISHMQWTPQDEAVAAAPATEIPTSIVINGNQPLAQIYQALRDKFPSQFVDFSSFSEDGAMLIFKVNSGYGEWGTRIQQDLIGGVKRAEAQHYGGSKRVCVFGASFGGYSAMMTVIRAPGLFKCAIGEAAIYDLAMMYDKGDIKDRKSGRNYLEQAIGKDPSKLADNSPGKLADKIDVPVLLIHGEADERAPFAQAKAMRAALEAAHKPYEWLTKPNEGHGFYKEENLVDMYNHVQGFLEKNIGPGVQAN
jgi:dipeptidyl aminopeptidase/acylaminoacyl peptidase